MIAAAQADHFSRVSAQSDDPPMRGYDDVQLHLETMLSKRMAQFARTDAKLDTSSREVDCSLVELIGIINSWKNPSKAA